MKNLKKKELRQSRHISNVWMNKFHSLPVQCSKIQMKRNVLVYVNCECVFSTMKEKPSLDGYSKVFITESGLNYI
jgi:hypothetical protein